MKTKLKISFSEYIKICIKNNIKYKKLFIVGKILDRISNWANLHLKYYRHYADNYQMRNRGPLTENEISEATKRETVNIDNSFKKRIELLEIAGNNRDENKYIWPYQRAAYLCEKVLEENRNAINTMVNVGARVDVVSNYLAKKFPDIKFISVDFQENLKEHNRSLGLCDNWSFVTGYALSLFEEGKLKADLVLFSSTATLFGATELMGYLKSLSSLTKFVVFNEPWWPPIKKWGFFKTFVPEDVNYQEPPVGGKHANYQHNYLKLLELNGFKVLSSELIPDVKYRCFILQVVGKMQ